MTAMVLVPAHFMSDLQAPADVLHVTLVPYDKEGTPQFDSAAATGLFRWWISREQGDRLIETHRRLKWIHTGSAGVDHILTRTFLSSGITLTNSAGVHAQSIAEWVIAGILASEKNLQQMFQQQAARVWEKVERDELTGKQVVILGSGRIASEIASRLRPFGVRLIAVRKSGEAHPLFDETYPVSDLPFALAEVDWLIVALPLTSATRALIDDRVLRQVPPHCRIINIARGEIIDEAALVDALRRNRLAGAILDVFSEEPLPADHPLWRMPNVLVLPHTTWRSPQVRQKQLGLFTENLRRFVNGEPLLNVVDVRSGY